MKRLFLILGLIILSGCGTTQVMKDVMESWHGKSIDDVISQWGYPDHTNEVRGSTMYIWSDAGTDYVSGSSYYDAYGTYISSPGYTVPTSCKRTFVAGDDGIIKHWEWEGNDCLEFRSTTYKKLVNPEFEAQRLADPK